MANVDISVSSTALIRGGGIAGDSVGGSASAHVAIDSCSATGSVSVNVTDSAQAFAGAAIGRLSNCGTVANTWTDTMVTCFSRGDRGQNAYAGGIAGMAGNEDVEGASFTQEEALSNAPAKQDGSFLIPSILGGGDA